MAVEHARQAERPLADPSAYRFVDTASGLVELVDELAAEPVYGIDTEFHRERTYFAQLALLQISWAGGIALVDPLAVDVAPFGEVLAGQGLAVLHAADQDLEVLERSCGRVPAALFDTQLAAGFIGFSSPSLSTLVDRLLSMRLEKGDQLTDWTRRPLTPEQRVYAAGDVAHLLELHRLITARLVATDRLGWAEQECTLMLERSRTPVVPEEAWWRLKQARQLRARERGVAQCVAAWRERRAQSLDRPTRFILSDLAVVSIAHRPPTSRAALEQVRGIDGRHLADGAALELLGAVSDGLALASSAVRLPPGPQGESIVKPAVALAAAWAGELAHQLEIDPAILATRADLVAFFQKVPEGRLVTTWRHELIGERLRRLIDGKAALALENGALVLEERSHIRV